MPHGSWLNDLPTSFFLAVHIAAFTIGPSFAWFAFQRLDPVPEARSPRQGICSTACCSDDRGCQTAPDGENGAMARVEIDVAAPPETVWGVLADPGAYSDWVVGTKVTQADANWPEVGSALEYRVEMGPVGGGDRTRVVEAEPPRLLVLRAGLQQFGAAGIRLELEPAAGGTHVVMEEDAIEGLVASLRTRVSDAVLKARGDIALGRLKRLAEARA